MQSWDVSGNSCPAEETFSKCHREALCASDSFLQFLSTLKLEKWGHVVFQLKRMKLLVEHFFCKDNMWTQPWKQMFLKFKSAHTTCLSLHNAQFTSFKAPVLPVWHLSPSLASTDHLELEVFRPNLEDSLVWKALASHLEVRQTALQSSTPRSPLLQIQT